MDSVTIANLALAHIGDQSIVSMDDSSQEARFTKLFYQQVRQELLRYHNWNFATSLVQLTTDPVAPIFDWGYAYYLPSDFFRLITVNSFGQEQPTETYQIQGNQLLSDAGEAKISYIADVVDENLFDSLFTEAFVLRLASKLAKPLSGSMDMSARLAQEAKYLLSEARRIDGADNSDRRKPAWVNSSLVRSRYS